MSNLSDDLSFDNFIDNVEYLRLFPLQMVLFPGISVPLHIFEERYKTMIGECIDGDVPFGIVLADEDGGAEIESVGTSAYITDVERLDEGRLNIMCAGERRFRIISLIDDQPYLGAWVEYLDPVVPASLNRKKVVRDVKSLFKAYVEKLLSITSQEDYTLELPRQPEVLYAIVASLMAIPLETRQELLMELDVESGLHKEVELLKVQMTKLEEAADSTRMTAVPLDTEKYQPLISRN